MHFSAEKEDIENRSDIFDRFICTQKWHRVTTLRVHRNRIDRSMRLIKKKFSYLEKE